MTRLRRSTNRAFTIAVCTSCSSENVLSAMEEFHSLIKRCPQGMLVRTNCLLGGRPSASKPTGDGVMVVLQPCSCDRRPTEPSIWFGPLEIIADVRCFCDFVARGRWEADEVARLPDQLLAHCNWTARLSRTN